MANGDGYEAFWNKGHEHDITVEILALEVFLDTFNILEDNSEGILSPLNVIGLDDHGLAGTVWYLDLVVHSNTINKSLTNYFVSF